MLDIQESPALSSTGLSFCLIILFRRWAPAPTKPDCRVDETVPKQNRASVAHGVVKGFDHVGTYRQCDLSAGLP
jgi:hypothetical protein